MAKVQMFIWGSRTMITEKYSKSRLLTTYSRDSKSKRIDLLKVDVEEAELQVKLVGNMLYAKKVNGI
jgi:UDP-glucose 6-dehydrogenase